MSKLTLNGVNVRQHWIEQDGSISCMLSNAEKRDIEKTTNGKLVFVNQTYNSEVKCGGTLKGHALPKNTIISLVC